VLDTKTIAPTVAAAMAIVIVEVENRFRMMVSF
jgi:hypothetical protein